MKIARKAGFAPKTEALGSELLGLPCCVGCAECQGLCLELVEALTLPDIVVKQPDDDADDTGKKRTEG